MLGFIVDNLDTALCLGIFRYLTKLQPQQQNADIINKSMVIFAFSYGTIKYTRLFHPSKQLESHIEAEWRSRIVGMVHAIVLIIGSILCFSEWPYRGDDAWVVKDPEVYYYPEIFASIFAGYLQYDLIWLIKNRKENFDLATIIHHLLYIPITHYVLWGRFFARPFAWLSVGELSTPFLHLRWFCIATDNKQSKLYSIYSNLFAITFLLTRVIGFGLGLVDLWLDRNIWLPLPVGLKFVILGVHMGFGLNLFWAKKVTNALFKHLKKD